MNIFEEIIQEELDYEDYYDFLNISEIGDWPNGELRVPGMPSADDSEGEDRVFIYGEDEVHI